MNPALAVIAKAPRAGRSKTRLCPPCTAEGAAALARAALGDTLAAVAATPASRRVLVLDGEPGSWLPAGFDVIRQRGSGLAERLAAAFADIGGACLLVGMDTPQITPAILREGLAALADADAVIGGAPDGGYWAIGFRRPCVGAFCGVPMSDPGTGAAQRARLAALGLAFTELRPLRDVDDIADARAVAALVPGSAFADELRAQESKKCVSGRSKRSPSRNMSTFSS